MDSRTPRRLNILAPLPFLAKGALSLAVLRAISERGHKVLVGYYLDGGDGYTEGPCTDFAAEGRLIDLTKSHSDEGIASFGTSASIWFCRSAPLGLFATALSEGDERRLASRRYSLQQHRPHPEPFSG